MTATPLTILKRAQTKLDKALESADQASTARSAALLAAAADGASRAEMAAATGLSQERITQVLRRAREGLDNGTATP